MNATIRQQIIALLRREELEAIDLSALLSIPEKEVYPHLEHIARTLGHNVDRLRIRPCQCMACGFVFKERHRFTKPGRCPLCHATRIRPPAYRITSGT
ncbi:MAG TPA: transcriptional regulator [Desulfurivibrionaceae bacterium]|nr:transcriptional regulator [Desulfurivibrionaceae bacterium]